MQKLELTSNNFFKIVLLLIGLTFLYLIRDIVLLLFIAVIIASALNPIVDLLEEENVPRWLAVLFIFLAVFFGLGVFINAVVPPLAQQGRLLIDSLPAFLESSWQTLRLDLFIGRGDVRQIAQELVSTFSRDLLQAPANVVRFGADILGQVLTLFSLTIFTFYLMLEHEHIREFLLSFISKGRRQEAEKVFTRVEEKLGAWLRGQVVMMILIGILTYLGLTALQIDFALPLALLAGLLEIIPIIGPLISVVPALIVAAAAEPLKAVGVATFYLLLQQLEGNVLVPRVMKQIVGLDPIVVILAIMIGARLAGPVGVLLSVPVAAVLMIIYQEFYSRSP